MTNARERKVRSGGPTHMRCTVRAVKMGPKQDDS